MTNVKQQILGVMSDLMFMVKIQDAAKRAGLEAVFVKSQEDALARAGEKPSMMILDLNYAAAEPLKLISALKSDEETKRIALVGFVSHVQVELRQAAQDRGCDVVMARSVFSQNLMGLLEQYAAHGPTANDLTKGTESE